MSKFSKALRVGMAVVMTLALTLTLAPAAFAAPTVKAPAPAAPSNGPIVIVNYKDGTQYASVKVDLASLEIIDEDAAYNFQRNDINNVVVTDSYVTLESVLAYAAEQGGLELDDIWGPSNFLTFTVDDDEPYTKYDGFTYDHLNTASLLGNYFYQGLLDDGTDPSGNPYGYDPTGGIAQYLTILALTTNSSEQTAGQDAQTAADELLAAGTTTDQAPRLLYGYPQPPDTGFDIGGNRFPSNIYSITIN